ncbi:putative integral membrane protein [Microbacterium esteraromaticum]|uniref:Putative integral membrane protein n=1 Tax=Microbacterium esteraromaticum TaxID=57043 RepID=A0A1R4JGA6_9MICO|nr:putative integral membrane protein [Microbacterium esteraromaticum]
MRVLWAAFLAAHLLVAWWGWVLPSQPMGDVVLVYQPWSAAALNGGAVVGITTTWVYPQLALVPMLLAQLFAVPFTSVMGGDGAYLIGWAILVTVCDLFGFAALVGRGRTRRRRTAGWMWTAALVLLGPIAMYRIDAITVPLAIVGGLWLAQRPRVGAALLTIGAWIKIWPAAIVLAAIADGRRAWSTAVTAASVTAVIMLVLVLLGADRALFGFLTEQTGRGLQIEAVAATPFLWLAMVGIASIDYSFDILTYQITAPGAEVVAALLTPLMGVVVLGILVVAVLRARHGVLWQRMLPALAMAVVVALIVTNKVGSPQFQTWLFAPAILWIVFDRPRAQLPSALVLLLCALTFTIYPLTYDGLLQAEAFPVLLITARNAVLVILLFHAVRSVVHAPVSPHLTRTR